MRKESVVAGWTGKVLIGQIDRRSFMERLAALGLTGAAIGTLSSLIPDVAQAAGDPTTLLIATSETPPGLDTEYNASRSSHEGIAQTMDALVQFDKKVGDDGLLYCDFDNLKGALAESWEIDPDGKAVTFHLRKGVMSHWGNELTADDVFYSWDRGYQLKSNRAFYYFFMKIKDPSSIKVLDKYTVKFQYEAPSFDCGRDALQPLSHHQRFQGLQGQLHRCRPVGEELDRQEWRRFRPLLRRYLAARPAGHLQGA